MTSDSRLDKILNVSVIYNLEIGFLYSLDYFTRRTLISEIQKKKKNLNFGKDRPNCEVIVPYFVYINNIPFKMNKRQIITYDLIF